MTLIATGTIKVLDMGGIVSDLFLGIAPFVFLILAIEVAFYILDLFLHHTKHDSQVKADDSYALKEYLYKHGGEKHREE